MVRFAVIGAGMWGKVHVKSIREEGRGRVEWICDAAEPAMKAAQEEFAIPHAATDFREALAAGDVDAVIVAAPPVAHVEIAMAALRAGKHLLVEKPLALTEADAARLVEEAARHPDLVALEGSARFTRIRPKFHFIHDLIASGQLGEVYHIHFQELKRASYVDYNPRAAAWAKSRSSAGGGALFDWAPYDLAFHLGLLDDRPELVSAMTLQKTNLRHDDLNANYEVEQHAAALMKFDTGLTCYYERGGGVHLEASSESRIYGTHGGLRFSYMPWDSYEIERFYEDASLKPAKQTLQVPKTGRFDNENTTLIAHFIDCLEGKLPPATPLPLAFKHLKIALRLLA